METLTATFKIVTPMFLGDAQQNAVDIRPPSVKGALRFWWRAMMWGKVLQEAEGDEAIALRCLHRKEAELFGSAADEKTGGQGKFLLRVVDQKIKTLSIAELKSNYPLSDGIGYLLGQGLYKAFQKERNDKKTGEIIKAIPAHYLRKAISSSESSSFNVELRFRQIDENSITQMENTLLLFGLFGGLGSRSRRGFGSVKIAKLVSGQAEKELPNSIAEIKEFFSKNIVLSEKTPFSAFSTTSRIDISSVDTNSWNLLDSLGEELQKYRSYGYENPKDQKRYVKRGVPAEQNFKDDHHCAEEVIKGGNNYIDQHPKRVIFGLPHNYYFSSVRKAEEYKKVDVAAYNPNAAQEEKGGGRRASLLFIHIHQLPDEKYAAIQFFLDAKFLPNNYQIEMSNQKLKVSLIKEKVQTESSVIHEYLDRFKINSGYTRIL